MNEEKEEIIENAIKTIQIDNGLNQEHYENRLRELLSKKFQIQEKIEKAIEDKLNYLRSYSIEFNLEPRIWEALEEIKEIQNTIDLLIEIFKRISKMEKK